MNYIFIDYRKITALSQLQDILIADDEVYLFVDINQQMSIPFSWLEYFINHKNKIHFLEIDLCIESNLFINLSFLIGKITAEDKSAKIRAFIDEQVFSNLSSLSTDIHLEWLSSSQLEENKNISQENLEVLEVKVEPQNICQDNPQQLEDCISQEINQEVIIDKSGVKEEAPITPIVQESKKERLKKKAIIANEIEFIRFTTNYIFNLFSTHLYLQKVTPPTLLIDLKNLLVTEYFPPEENFMLSEQTDNILENVLSRLEKKRFIEIDNNEEVTYSLSIEMIYQNFLQLIQQQQPKKYNGILHIAKTELFFLGENQESVNEIIEKAKSNGLFDIQNKRVIYPSKIQDSTSQAKNDDCNQSQDLQLKRIKIKKNLSAHHPKVGLLTSRQITEQEDNDPQFQLALKLIKNPNRPKKIKHLKRFLSAKIATDDEGVDNLIKRLFKERYIIVSNDEKITYRTELIRNSHYEKVVHFLKNGSQFKPKEEESLFNAIASCLGNKVSQAECQAIIKQLIDDRYITIENGIAKYQL